MIKEVIDSVVQTVKPLLFILVLVVLAMLTIGFFTLVGNIVQFFLPSIDFLWCVIIGGFIILVLAFLYGFIGTLMGKKVIPGNLL